MDRPSVGQFDLGLALAAGAQSAAQILKMVIDITLEASGLLVMLDQLLKGAAWPHDLG